MRMDQPLRKVRVNNKKVVQGVGKTLRSIEDENSDGQAPLRSRGQLKNTGNGFSIWGRRTPPSGGCGSKTGITKLSGAKTPKFS